MNGRETEGKILVIDFDPDLMRHLGAEVKRHRRHFTICSSLDDGMAAIEDHGQAFQAIFLNPQMQPPYALEVLQKIKKLRPASLFFYICEAHRIPFSSEELKYYGIEGLVAKPATALALASRAGVSFDIISAATLIELAAQHGDPLGVEFDAEDGEFFEIRSEYYFSGTTTLFDLYQRVGPGRYLKTHAAGSPESNGDKDRPAIFHLRRTALRSFILFGLRVGATLVKKQGVPEIVSIGFVLALGEHVLDWVSKNRTDAERPEIQEEYINLIREAVSLLESGSPRKLKLQLFELSHHRYELLLALVSVLIISRQKFLSFRSYSAVVETCLFHQLAKTDSRDEEPRNSLDERSGIGELLVCVEKFVSVLRTADSPLALDWMIEFEHPATKGKSDFCTGAFREVFCEPRKVG